MWFKINTKEFGELTGDIYNKQNEKQKKIMISKIQKKKKKKKGLEVTARKTTKSEAKELYKELIQKDIDALEIEKSNNTKKHKILKILNNLGTIFTGTYLHHKDVPKKQCSKEVSQ